MMQQPFQWLAAAVLKIAHSVAGKEAAYDFQSAKKNTGCCCCCCILLVLNLGFGVDASDG